MLSNLKSVEENKEYLKSVLGERGKLIDWVNSPGKEIECKYYWNDSEYFKKVLKIDRYEDKRIYFKGYEKGIKVGNLTRCRLGNILGFRTLEFKFEIGTTIKELLLMDKEYRKDKKGKEWKYYKYKCNKCGNIDWIREGDLKQGKGCNVCSGKKVVLGINTIWDVARWMVDFGISEEDMKTYTFQTSKKIKVKCPDCGRIKETTPNKIYNLHSIQCSCGDGVSYPEKLTENLLIQLDVKYKRQYKDYWSQNKVYDFYLPDCNTIIEVHGEQHYKETTRGRSLKEEQENDRLKEELALKNGIEHYMVIDCRKSELEYIKNNILNSELNELFDLNKIVNWNKCEEYALKNKIKEVCNYYKEHHGISTIDLAKEFDVDRATIIRYLNKGAKLGWCEYDGKEEMRSSNKRNGKLIAERKGKPVSQFTLEGEFIKTYPSAMEVERQIGIAQSNIGACCRGKYKTAGGFIWKFSD